MQNVELKIDGMSCQGCANSVHKALAAVDGVSSVEVAWAEGRARVLFDSRLTDAAALASAVADAGFDVVPD